MQIIETIRDGLSMGLFLTVLLFILAVLCGSI